MPASGILNIAISKTHALIHTSNLTLVRMHLALSEATIESHEAFIFVFVCPVVLQECNQHVYLCMQVLILTQWHGHTICQAMGPICLSCSVEVQLWH